MSFIFSVFHFEISGKDVNEEHLMNKPLIYSILSIFQTEISGNDFNEEHP